MSTVTFPGRKAAIAPEPVTVLGSETELPPIAVPASCKIAGLVIAAASLSELIFKASKEIETVGRDPTAISTE